MTLAYVAGHWVVNSRDPDSKPYCLLLNHNPEIYRVEAIFIVPDLTYAKYKGIFPLTNV